MTELLTVALVQTDIYWQDPVANLARLEERLAADLPPGTDMVVLPEMFTTGFSMNAGLVAEVPDLTATRWMKQMAALHRSLVVGSVPVRENGKYYNRLLCADPQGNVTAYDKRHLFRMAGEDTVYTAGARRVVLSWKGWKICPLICYDLRFPVWSRNLPADPYDVLVYVANWPSPRSSAWRALLPARAIENQSYVIGVNRTGTDGNGTGYSGDSLALDFRGEPLADLGPADRIGVVRLSGSSLSEYRRDFPAWQDADEFELKN